MENFDPAYIDEIARRIAWTYWKSLNSRGVSRDEFSLWESIGEERREAYRKAALAVAGM